MPVPLVVATDDPRRAPVTELLRRHLAFADAHSPGEYVHALDTDALVRPDITFVSVSDGEAVLGVGALRELDPTHGELKSMHVAEEARGRGVGRAVLDHLLDLARSRGYARVSLETGTPDAFTPARALYASVGFEACPPFADYTDNPWSTCMTLELGAGKPSERP